MRTSYYIYRLAAIPGYVSVVKLNYIFFLITGLKMLWLIEISIFYYNNYVYLGKKTSTDLLFLLGASGPTQQQIFSTEKLIAKDMIDSLSLEDTNIGAILYGRDSIVAIAMGQYKSKSYLKTAIDQLNLPSGSTSGNIDDALQTAYSEVLERKQHSDIGRRNVIVLFINQKPSTEAIKTAKNLRDQNIKIIVVALGSSLTKSDVKDLAGNSDDVVLVPDTTDIKENVAKDIVDKTSPSMDIFLYYDILGCKS